MLCMQYSFVLPAGYDMALIRNRIESKGHLLNGFNGLKFKAYLYACQDENQPASENLYAPFYLWENSDGMSEFLSSAGFARLCRDFGVPSVKTWVPWFSELQANLTEAKYASREIVSIPAYCDLAELKAQETARARQSITERGALASLVAFEPSNWSLVRFSLWRDRPLSGENPVQLYDVGYIAQ
ncbi:DUF4865 family protein [Tolumonas lignilytica]|uniref:DUF4865 family protein n=1 Tax=Tolumonas lignilytica TaxID=1283284 RepID=UPI000570A4F3|nr:DUF4865 family protein [Tolumonas lignilytica]